MQGEQRQAFAQWQAADPEHRRAWLRLQHLQQTLGGVPADSAHADVTIRYATAPSPDLF